MHYIYLIYKWSLRTEKCEFLTLILKNLKKKKTMKPALKFYQEIENVLEIEDKKLHLQILNHSQKILNLLGFLISLPVNSKDCR
jgi:transposase